MNEKINQIMQKRPAIELPDTIPDPLAMMIHTINTNIASTTMIISLGFDSLTYLALLYFLVTSLFLLM